MIEVNAQQGNRIRELVALGMDPDEALNKVLKERGTPPPAPKKNKYGAVKQEEDGYTFDSTKERNRYLELVEQVGDGTIANLEVHPKYRFEHNNVLIGTYSPDFQYLCAGQLVVEDVKSEPTRKKADYRLRKKMMLAYYNIDVKEI